MARSRHGSDSRVTPPPLLLSICLLPVSVTVSPHQLLSSALMFDTAWLSHAGSQRQHTDNVCQCGIGKSLPLSYNQTIVISKTKTLKVCFTDAERERHSLQLIKSVQNPFFLGKRETGTIICLHTCQHRHRHHSFFSGKIQFNSVVLYSTISQQLPQGALHCKAKTL